MRVQYYTYQIQIPYIHNIIRPQFLSSTSQHAKVKKTLLTCMPYFIGARICSWIQPRIQPLSLVRVSFSSYFQLPLPFYFWCSYTLFSEYYRCLKHSFKKISFQRSIQNSSYKNYALAWKFRLLSLKSGLLLYNTI